MEELEREYKREMNTPNAGRINEGKRNDDWDYTDRPELCSSDHEPGLEGANEMRLRMEDRTAAAGKITVVVKKGPNAPSFRDRQLILTTCLHEAGHALGIHGHSPNTHDVMFLAASPNAKPKLTERDKNTIRVMYKSGWK